ncbi:TonB-dependent receptor [Flaviaesturariibacter flavus]|nr:TonB-dependent receptor plug domain-containing protein [Flaviaesturariibacter flavus]
MTTASTCPPALLFLGPLLASLAANGQEADSSVQLGEVRVQAFEGARRLRNLPAPVQYIGQRTLGRFAPTAIVQAVNSTLGVRMEERSPGSYRFNIRGSALRSPFGVRNVKVYFNDLPITDPGGHTYLNQLGYYNFHHLEIIRGPGSSLYGAGTGGALLIESSDTAERPGLLTEWAGGSYGLLNAYGRIITGSEKMQNKIGFQHQESVGYRAHSRLRRDVLSWTGNFRPAAGRQLKTTFLYGDLKYETPGALTATEYALDPKAARPGTQFFPGAEEAQASIRQQQLLAGLAYEQELLPRLTAKSSAYTQFTLLRNPTLQNYARSNEAHGGLRGLLSYRLPLGAGNRLRFDGGTEWQEGFTTLAINKSDAGNPDSLRYIDEIRNRQVLFFLQAVADIGPWTLTAGTSRNFLRVLFQRYSPASAGLQEQRFRQWSPRVALLRRLGRWSLWGAFSRGFSPPTTAELLPSGGTINTGLSAELGDNFELGLKAAPLRGLFVEVSGYHFRLRNTIVQRRTAGGGDFFVNAGGTRQQGIEAQARYELLPRATFTEGTGFWVAYTWQHYRYQDFRQVTEDYSGNALPGIAPHTLAAGADLWLKGRFFATLTYYYSDRLPLSDANDVYAAAYHLVGAKVGLQHWWKARLRVKLFVGADNLLDERYSLGNDINGFGGRYFNAAAGRNWYAALVVEHLFREARPRDNIQ